MTKPAATQARPSRLVGALSWVEAHLGHLAALFAAVFLFATRTQPLRTNWGDPWSDANVQTTGRYFAKTGFIRHAFTPIVDVGPLKPDSLQYTHYPPLPDIVNGVQQRLFGTLDIASYRILPDILSLVSLFFFHRIVRSLWGARTAGYSLALLVTNLLWLQYADCIHHVPLYWCSGFGAVYAGVRWLETERRGFLAGVIVGCLVCMMASYDYAFFVPVLMVSAIGVKGVRFRERRGLMLLGALGAGLAAGVLIKLALVTWAVGPRELVADLKFQFEERATSKHSAPYRAGLVPIVFWRLVRFFTPLSFAVLAVQLYALARKLLRREPRAIGPGPLVFLAAGLPFTLVFTQLFVEQYHPTLQFLPYYAVACAAVLVAMRERGGAKASAAAAAAFVFLVGWQMRELASFKKTFLDRDDIATVERAMRGKPDHDFMLTNTLLDFPVVRYYLDRYVMGANFPDREATLAYVLRLFDDLGSDRPIRFLEMQGVDDMVFDKMVYGLFANEAKWDWISRPAAFRSEWQPVARAQAAASVALFRDVGVVEVDTPTLRVYRVDASAVESYLRRRLPDGETRAIDFGSVDSNAFKVNGLRYPERDGSGVGFAWQVERQRKHLRMTMKGVLFIADGPKDPTATLRIRVTPARERKLTLSLLTLVPDQRVTVSVNGHAVGSAPVVDKWSEASFVIPASALVADPVQTVELQVAKVSEYGTGVALSSLRIDDP